MAIGTTSAVKTVTLVNVGTIAVTITGIVITGTNAGAFAQTTVAAFITCKRKLLHQCYLQANDERDAPGGARAIAIGQKLGAAISWRAGHSGNQVVTSRFFLS